MKGNEFDIKLEVAGRTYSVPVRRGNEEEEFLYREAAKRVEQHLIQYRQYFAKSLGDAQLLTMVAIHLARDVLRLEAENDLETYARKIRLWMDQLDDYLKK
ncbi:MAG: cell division protein ZapA [Tannerella sp.]|nr:cell division protein ZapA [Tannerella sp.]